MRKILLAGIGILVLVLAAYGGWLFFGHQTSWDQVEDVTVAYSPYESGALFWIALDRGYFNENGLNITLKRYESGAGSLDGVVNGEADMTVGVTEFPLVRKAFDRAHVRTIGVIDRGFFTYLVARKDLVASPEDLRGKRIGTAFGTIAEFHLGRFLTLEGINMSDITLVDVKTSEGWVNDVANGSIDAIATAQPYADKARDRLGAYAAVWSIQSSQPLYANVVCSDSWIDAHHGAAERFLRALGKAEEFTASHPGEAKAIVQRRLFFDPGYMDTVWTQNQFGLTLDQSLVFAMEDEARWMIANNMTNATAIPDFRENIYTGAMNAVRPGSVNILG